MEYFKRIMSFALAMVMVLSMLPVQAMADTGETVHGVQDMQTEGTADP